MTTQKFVNELVERIQEEIQREHPEYVPKPSGRLFEITYTGKIMVEAGDPESAKKVARETLNEMGGPEIGLDDVDVKAKEISRPEDIAPGWESAMPFSENSGLEGPTCLELASRCRKEGN